VLARSYRCPALIYSASVCVMVCFSVVGTIPAPVPLSPGRRWRCQAAAMGITRRAMRSACLALLPCARNPIIWRRSARWHKAQSAQVM
jgi:hypothetical protein